MAILKIKDANGNVQEVLAIRGKDGKDYVLTDADKQEIASMVSGGGGGTIDLSGYTHFKKVTDEEINNFEWTDETKKTVKYYESVADAPFYCAVVFSYGNDLNGLMYQVAITDEGDIYNRYAEDNFAEWHLCTISRTEIDNLANDFSEYAQTVDDTISNHEERILACEENIGGGTVDLSGYATTTYVDNTFATKEQLSTLDGEISTSMNWWTEQLEFISDNYTTEERVLELIQANMPTSGDEVSY